MKKRILLIEDEAAVASYLGTFLEQNSFEVTRAGSLAEARALLGRGYDLILLDLMFPDGTGDELLPEIAQTAPGTPVLIVTGVSPDHEKLIHCLKSGAAGYVNKSAQVDELLRHLQRALRE